MPFWIKLGQCIYTIPSFNLLLSNWFFLRALVKMSPILSSILQYIMIMFPFSTLFLKKWCVLSMFFVHCDGLDSFPCWLHLCSHIWEEWYWCVLQNLQTVASSNEVRHSRMHPLHTWLQLLRELLSFVSLFPKRWVKTQESVIP